MRWKYKIFLLLGLLVLSLHFVSATANLINDTPKKWGIVNGGWSTAGNTTNWTAYGSGTSVHLNSTVIANYNGTINNLSLFSCSLEGCAGAFTYHANTTLIWWYTDNTNSGFVYGKDAFYNSAYAEDIILNPNPTKNVFQISIFATGLNGQLGGTNWDVLAIGNISFITTTASLSNASFDTPTFSPGNNSAYVSTFNLSASINITKSNGTSLFEIRGKNYTASNSTLGNYTATFTNLNLSVGDWKIIYGSYGTDGSWNSTSTWYTIAKAFPKLTLTCSSPITYGTSTDCSGSDPNLGDNDLTYSVNESNGVFQAGTKNFNYSTAGGQNYTANSSITSVTINRATPTVTTFINGSSVNVQNISYPSQLNFSGYLTGNTEQTLEVFLNGTGMISSNGLFQNLMSSYYNFTARVNQSQNYSALAVTQFVNLTKGTLQGSITITPSSSITFGTQSSSSYAEGNNGDGDIVYTFFRNAISVSSPDVQTLGGGSWIYIINSSGGQNWSNTSIFSSTLTVNKAGNTLNPLINGVTANLSVTFPQQVNVTITSNVTTATIKLNGTTLTSGANNTFGGNVWFLNVTAPTNQNYTANESNWYVTINKGSTNLLLWLNNSQSNLNVLQYDIYDLNITLNPSANGYRTLYVNDTLVGNSTLDFDNLTNFTLITTYNISANYEGNQNWTNQWVSYNVISSPIAPPTPVPGNGGGGGGASPNNAVNDYVCQRTLSYINSYGQNNFLHLDELRQDMLLDKNYVITTTQLQNYVLGWQGLCSDLINRTINEVGVCDKIYYFLIQNNDTYNPQTINNLRYDIRNTLNLDISNKVLGVYADNYDTKCYPVNNKRLPFTKTLSILNIDKIITATPLCSPDTNNSIIDAGIRGFMSIGIDSSCDSLDTKRWFFTIDQDSSGSYNITGVRLWIPIVLVISFLFYVLIKNNKKKHKSLLDAIKGGTVFNP